MSAVERTWWGWHELGSSTVARLVAQAELRTGDLVIDAGAGSGAITAALLREGARVVAVELHPRRAALLRERFAADRVTVARVDLADLHLPRQPFRVVANPPFGVVTALLRRLVAQGSRLECAVIVVPGYVAARWTSGAAPGVHRWGQRFTVRVAGTVPARAFRPRPPRSAKILVIERR
ncbi:MAG: rRNA adenine N-6-methyltransferase family protein [Actinomycetes bacterium]